MLDIVCKIEEGKYIGLIQTEKDGPVRIFTMDENGSFKSTDEIPSAEFGKYIEHLTKKN